MILTRLTAHLRSQNWFAVVLEFVIVAVGVVMGLQVSNWNDNRLALAESEQTLKLVISELDQYTKNAELFKVYYATTRAYGEAACHSVAHTRRPR